MKTISNLTLQFIVFVIIFYKANAKGNNSISPEKDQETIKKAKDMIMKSLQDTEQGNDKSKNCHTNIMMSNFKVKKEAGQGSEYNFEWKTMYYTQCKTDSSSEHKKDTKAQTSICKATVSNKTGANLTFVEGKKTKCTKMVSETHAVN